jgi:hypothetical protein
MKKLTLITFLVFMIEAIVHFNQGANYEREQKIFLPPTKSLIHIAIVVLIFSYINAYIYKKVA